MIARQIATARRGRVQRRVGIVDPHPVTRRGLRALIGGEPDLEVVGECDAATEAVDLVRNCRLGLLVVDPAAMGAGPGEATGAAAAGVPGSEPGDAIAMLRRVRAVDRTLGILVFTAAASAGFAEGCLRAGADGVLEKREPGDRVLGAIRTVLAGGTVVPPRLLRRFVREPSPLAALTAREREVLEWIGRGESTRAIAAALGLSVRTIESHRGNIKRKLGISSGPRLIQFAVQWLTASESSAPLSPR